MLLNFFLFLMVWGPDLAVLTGYSCYVLGGSIRLQGLNLNLPQANMCGSILSNICATVFVTRPWQREMTIWVEADLKFFS